jgi:cyclase
MLKSRIFPLLLLHDGGLVKSQGFSNYKYVGDPINAVRIFNEKEVDELALFDIDATVKNQPPKFELLKSIATESRMPLCYGGGVRDAETAARLVSIGFEKVSVSSAALIRPKIVREMADRIGSQSVVVTIDAKRGGFLRSNCQIYTHNSKVRYDIGLIDFAKKCEDSGAGEIIINSINYDGMMTGLDLECVETLRNAISVPLSIIGGVGSLAHIKEAVDRFGPIGVGVGSFFVFKGKYRAVLISYCRPEVGF